MVLNIKHFKRLTDLFCFIMALQASIMGKSTVKAHEEGVADRKRNLLEMHSDSMFENNLCSTLIFLSFSFDLHFSHVLFVLV